MERFLKKFKNIMAAAAFAEANEHDTAKEIYMDPDFMNIKGKG